MAHSSVLAITHAHFPTTPNMLMTLEDLLACRTLSADDKARALRCYARVRELAMLHMPLKTGDVVVTIMHRGDSGTLGAFDEATGRWEISRLGAWVRPVDLIKDEWLRPVDLFNDVWARNSITVDMGGLSYRLRIEADRNVRCLTPSGLVGAYGSR
jgi:hypothetical protein